MLPNGQPYSRALVLISLNAAPNSVGKVPASLVCTLTLIISNGHKAISAKNSAVAEAPAQTNALYLMDASSPNMLAYSSLKNSLNPNLTAPCACYPSAVGTHPFSSAAIPSSLAIPENPLNTLVNLPGFACMLHFTTSSGVTSVCVNPQAKAPPNKHFTY